MDESQLQTQLQTALAALETRNREFDALLEATKKLQDSSDQLADLERRRRKENKALEQRVAELEAANQQLTNMLWGRRSERRVFDPNQQQLFSDLAEVERTFRRTRNQFGGIFERWWFTSNLESAPT